MMFTWYIMCISSVMKSGKKKKDYKVNQNLLMLALL